MENGVRIKLVASAAALFAAGAALLCALAAGHTATNRPPHLALQPANLLADGYDAATLTIDGPQGGTPIITIPGNAHAAKIEDATHVDGHWEAQVRAGVMPAAVRILVAFPGSPAAEVALTTELATADSGGDGTPDFLRLEDERDQRNFRRWFAYLAEAQYFQQPGQKPAEIRDCAALIRYAYREALHAHDRAWAASAHLPMMPAFDSPAKYEYPYTALGASLYRVKSGPFQAADVTSGAFAQFADVKTLWRYNTHFISRDLARALPGDLLFYRQESGDEPYHSMIYVGQSQVQSARDRYVVYHTGPTRAEGVEDPGEMRRPTVDELLHFPQSEWRPNPGNPAFLGVFRWNILRRSEAHS